MANDDPRWWRATGVRHSIDDREILEAFQVSLRLSSATDRMSGARACAPVHTLRNDTHSIDCTDRVFLRLGGGEAGAQIAMTADMSQKTVQLVMGRLLTDEDLRLRFVERPRETLSDLREQGYELTADEIDALVRSDPGMWPSMARRIHPRLQRCSLRHA
jgi:hypothetical protein